MASLIEAAKEPAYPAEIVGVVSNKADAPGLAIARAEGISAEAVPHRDYASREDHDRAMDAVLRDLGAEIVCCAGYMRIMTPWLIGQWAGRMINIHPSLLPLFKGLHTHEQALAAGVRVHGCTVHFVTEEMDAGPIIAQAAVPVMPGDTAETLAARVLGAEHRLYPAALRDVVVGKVAMVDGRLVWQGRLEAATGILFSPPV
jgi:formyltetrahydrofolate-dependent phosphoribosylglycinamide formyltransferase